MQMAASTIQHAAKAALRKEMRQRLKPLTSSERQRQSDVVVQRLLTTDYYVKSKRVSIFLSMYDEIRTEGLLTRMFQDGKTCYMPHYVGDCMEMVRLYSMEDYDSLPETKWKIKQPPDDEVRESALDTGGLDLVLVPGLAFTTKGARLGRGKGYYDKYLRRCVERTKRRPVMVALAFREAVLDFVPMGENDFTLDGVLFDDTGHPGLTE